MSDEGEKRPVDNDISTLAALAKSGAKGKIHYNALMETWNSLYGTTHETSDIESVFADIDQSSIETLAGLPASSTNVGAIGENVGQMLENFAHATLLVDATGQIAVANQAASEKFDLYVGNSITEIPYSLNTDKPITEFIGEILRPGRNETNPKLIQAFSNENESSITFALIPAAKSNSTKPLALVFVIDPTWFREASDLLQQEYNLTEAEKEVLIAFIEGGSMQEISTQRKRSYTTVRTQFQTVLAKVGARNQAELLRNTLALSQFVGDLKKMAEPFRNPYRKNLNILRPNGRSMEVTMCGDFTGQPVIYLGNLTQYTFPATSEAMLEKAGLCVISMCPPGIGGTSPAANEQEYMQCYSEDVMALMSQLSLEQCPVWAYNQASARGIQLATMIPQKISKLIITAAFPPQKYIDPDQVRSPWAAAITRAITNTPSLVKLLVQFSWRAIKIMGTKKFVTIQLKKFPPDVEISIQDENARETDFALETFFKQGSKRAAIEFEFVLGNWQQYVEKCTVPVTLLHGEFDTVNSIESIRAFAADYPKKLNLIELPNVGHTFFFTHLQKIIDQLKSD